MHRLRSVLHVLRDNLIIYLPFVGESLVPKKRFCGFCVEPITDEFGECVNGAPGCQVINEVLVRVNFEYVIALHTVISA